MERGELREGRGGRGKGGERGKGGGRGKRGKEEKRPVMIYSSLMWFLLNISSNYDADIASERAPLLYQPIHSQFRVYPLPASLSFLFYHLTSFILFIFY